MLLRVYRNCPFIIIIIINVIMSTVAQMARLLRLVQQRLGLDGWAQRRVLVIVTMAETVRATMHSCTKPALACVRDDV